MFAMEGDRQPDLKSRVCPPGLEPQCCASVLNQLEAAFGGALAEHRPPLSGVRGSGEGTEPPLAPTCLDPPPSKRIAQLDPSIALLLSTISLLLFVCLGIAVVRWRDTRSSR